MAKRKKSPAERRAARQRIKDHELIRRYARHCYQEARKERAQEVLVPLYGIGPVDGQRHQDVIDMAERAIREWWNGLPPHSRPGARRKMRQELGEEPGYNPPHATGG